MLVAVVDVVVLSIRVFISRWCERYLSFLSFARRTRSYACSVTLSARSCLYSLFFSRARSSRASIAPATTKKLKITGWD